MQVDLRRVLDIRCAGAAAIVLSPLVLRVDTCNSLKAED